MRAILFGLLILLFSAGATSALSLSNAGGGDWKYYREITVKENSGSTLTDYQILIELNSANFDFSKAKPDGSDIRFVDSEGNELSYWIEEWSSGKAKIWVKVPAIQANGQTKIKMYYGNPSANAVSDGDATFEFFDDFERAGLDTTKWNFLSSRGSCASLSVQYGYAKLDAPNDCDAELRTKLTFSRDIAVEYQVISTGKQADGSGGIGTTYGDSENTNAYEFALEHKSYDSLYSKACRDAKCPRCSCISQERLFFSAEQYGKYVFCCENR